MTGRKPAPEGDAGQQLQLYRTLGDVVADVAAAHDITDACRRLADLSVRHLNVDMAGVYRHPRRGEPDLVAATDVLVAEVTALRTAYPDLPGAAPLAEGEILFVSDLARRTDAAWSAVPARLGLRSALLVGLPTLSSGPATLELYSRQSGRVAGVESEIAEFARLGGLVLRDVERRANLEEALHTRDIIGRAQGVLMERYELTSEQAMNFLRRQSQQSQQPIRDLAAEVVGQREAESRAPNRDVDSE